jgi:hypothetical protein
LAPEQLAKIQDDYQLNYVIGVLGGNEMNPDYAKLLLNGRIGEKFPEHTGLVILRGQAAKAVEFGASASSGAGAGAGAGSGSSTDTGQSKAAFVAAFIKAYSLRSKDGVFGSIFRNTNFLRQLLLLGNDDEKFTRIRSHYIEKPESRTTTVVQDLLKKGFSNFSSDFGKG